MKLSTRVRFALRIMMLIAAESKVKPVFSRRVAALQGISEAYVDQILLPLRTGGLLISHRGRSGGYQLAKPATEITVLDIVETVEGPVNLVDCVDKPESCNRVADCVAHDVWANLTKTVRQSLRQFTLEKLCADQRRKSHSGDYVI